VSSGSDEAAAGLRAATPADAPAATALAHLAKAHWGYPPEWMQAWAAELAVSAGYLERHRAWCAESTGRLVGFCALEEAPAGWELASLWVDPGWQGLGVGRALAACALEEARRLRPDWAVRVVADPNAVGFYERLGGRRVGALPAPMPGAGERVLPVLSFEGPRPVSPDRPCTSPRTG
jgi:ribosomal protein S18 acetylase RimI-like enzyme